MKKRPPTRGRTSAPETRLIVSPLSTFRWVEGQLLGRSSTISGYRVFNDDEYAVIAQFSRGATLREGYQKSTATGQLSWRRFREFVGSLVELGFLETVPAAEEALGRLGWLDMRCHEILQCDLGHARSLRADKPVDATDRPIPLLCYPAIDYLARFDLSGMRVFEFGSGNSTVWWSERAAHVTSVETDPGWFEVFKEHKPENVALLLRTTQHAVVAAIDEDDTQYHVVVIDHTGPREPAARAALRRCLPGGLIILDNSEWHHAAVMALRHPDFLEVNLSGFAPCEHFIHGTSLFFHRAFDFPRLHPEEPVLPLGGLPPNSAVK